MRPQADENTRDEKEKFEPANEKQTQYKPKQRKHR